MPPLQLVTEPVFLSSEQAFSRLADRPYIAFLDSSVLEPSIGRYSIIAFNPVAVIHTADEWTKRMVAWRDRVIATDEPSADIHEWPFKGGWIGYVSYEFHQCVIPQVPGRPTQYPLLSMAFYDSFLLFDHQNETAFVASLGLIDPAGSTDTGLARERLQAAQAALTEAPTQRRENVHSTPLQAMSSPADYLKSVRRIQEYIRAGDCYQVNYTQRFVGTTSRSAPELYQRLRGMSPAPMAAYLDVGSFQILSASPESFLAIRDRQVETRPIKGTRPRGHTDREDAALKTSLWESEKDRAELLMITDLERNDLGRVCVPGSVQTKSLVALQSLQQVHHLYSLIEGRLPDDVTIWDVLMACFPGGSISGAPKIRAMQIIRELEPHSREAYTGAIGFISLDGTSHWNIPIRTLIYERGEVTTYAGGGIIADSNPDAEYEECLVKLEGVRKAVSG